MKKNPRIKATLLFSAISLFSLTNCTDNTELETATQAESVAAENDGEAAGSITIDGTYTVLTSTTNCSKCDFIVPENLAVVDAKQIGIQPGQAICLDAAIRYGNISIINVEGEPDKPVTIAYGVETLSARD